MRQKRKYLQMSRFSSIQNSYLKSAMEKYFHTKFDRPQRKPFTKVELEKKSLFFKEKFSLFENLPSELAHILEVSDCLP